MQEMEEGKMKKQNKEEHTIKGKISKQIFCLNFCKEKNDIPLYEILLKAE